MSRNQLSVVVLPLLLTILTGCTSMSLKKPDVWPFTIADEKPGMPSQVVANWTDTILYQGNEAPVRGFGGRLIFYGEGKKEPIKIEGTLTVYAFDEKNRDPNNVKPDRKFVFTKDQLATHYSKSKLGHSYSVWIPWDEAGGEQKEVSLIVRFTPEKGSVVVSEQTRHILPGKIQDLAKKSNLPALGQGNDAIQPASYAAPMNPNDSGREAPSGQPRSITTTTIAVPPSSLLTTMPRLGQNANVGGNFTPPNAAPHGAANSVNAPNSPATRQPDAAGINSANSSVPQYPAHQPPIRSGLGRFPAPRASFSQPATYRAPWQPSPSGSGFGPAATPGAATNYGFPTPPEGAGSSTY